VELTLIATFFVEAETSYMPLNLGRKNVRLLRVPI